MEHQFELFKARAAKEEAMRRVDDHADPDWRPFMMGIITETARTKRRFSTDDVLKLARERHGPETHELRALGPLMASAARCQLIRKDGFEICQRPSRHCAPIQMWRSLIFDPDPMSS